MEPPTGDHASTALTEIGDGDSTGETRSPDETLRPGLVLGGRYELLAPLGSGAMGEVWKGRHVDLGTPVALKILTLRGDDGRDAVGAERMLREAQLVSQIDHPHIVRITDFGRTDRGTPFFSMDLVAGQPLSMVIRRDAPLPWPRARHLLLQIADALAVAHAQGIVHRDVKPSNILVVEDPAEGEQIRLIDFGIAKSFVLDERLKKLTRTGMVFGTPAYMSPEQAQGKPIDARSDIYSFGCVAYELLTAQRPFPVDTPHEQIFRRIHEDVPDLRGVAVPPGLQSLVLSCLRRDAACRAQTMADVRVALLSIEGNPQRATAIAPHVPVPMANAPSGEEPTRTRSRPVWQLVAGGLIAAACAAGLGVWAWLSIDRSEAADQAPPAPPPRLEVPPVRASGEITEPAAPERAPAHPPSAPSVAPPADPTERMPDVAAEPEPPKETSSSSPPPPRPRPKRAGRRESDKETSSAPTSPPESAPSETPRVPKRRDNGTFDVFGESG